MDVIVYAAQSNLGGVEGLAVFQDQWAARYAVMRCFWYGNTRRYRSCLGI